MRQQLDEALLEGVEVVAEVARGPRMDQLALSDDADLSPLTLIRPQFVDAMGGELGVFQTAQTLAGGLPHAVPVNV